MNKFRHKPTRKQFEALKFLYDEDTEYLLFGGGAGGGKSWIGCEWLIAMCLNFPEIRTFIGRKTLKVIKNTTLITFFKVCKKYEIQRDIHYSYNDQRSIITFHNGSTIDLLELKIQPSDPMFEDMGSSEYTIGWIEEAGEVHFNAFDTLKSRVGRHLNEKYGILAKILITCNPKKNWLYTTFYQPWKNGTLERKYIFLQSLAKDNPELDIGYLNKLDEIKDKAKKERLKYGNWEYDDDPAALMDYDSITDLFTNAHVPGGEKFITADIARYGADKTTVMIWDGMRVQKIVKWEKENTVFTANKIRQLAIEHSVPMSHVIVDDDGIGGGVTDQLDCKGFVNNSSPLNDDNFDNLKSQCYFKLSELVNEKKLFVNCSDEEIKDCLIEELEHVKQKNMDSDNKKGVVPKEKIKDLIGRSPDYSDTLMMRMYFELEPVIETAWSFVKRR